MNEPGERPPDLVGFAAALRSAGVSVSIDATVTAAEALVLLDPPSGGDLYWACRSTLVHRRQDLDPFDDVFRRHFLGATPTDQGGPSPELLLGADDEGDGGDQEQGTDAAADAALRWSAVEVLGQADLADLDQAELAELWPAVEALAVRRPRVRSRRLRPSRHGRALDVRRSIGDAVRRDGELLRLVRRSRRERLRRLVLLVDVSGSMEPYARAMLRFAHAAMRSGPGVEVFSLGTRLTRLTAELATPDPDRALSAATRAAADWSGGTRLGEGLGVFIDRWGRRGAARGAVVVILSDGWDRGDPGVMGERMSQLSRLAHRIVWVNPLKATPGYEPLARGMAAALPYCDRFVEGHSFRSLEGLAALVAEEQRR